MAHGWGDESPAPRWTLDTWVTLAVIVATFLIGAWIEGRP